MEGGDKDKDNRRTKLKTASARRANAEENPHIKRARKKGPPSQSDAADVTSDAAAASDTAAASSVLHDPRAQCESQPDVDASTTLTEPATDADPAETGREPDTTDYRDDVARDIEVEEHMREDGEVGGSTRRNMWTDPYDGLPVLDVFPGGLSNTTVLTSYPRHVARHIYDSHVS
ncbi:hypothetical protein P8452_27866 [Trifolium repens]|nr:hypothetical protein P8452_27866 [Trifolium repens]